jgi:RHS repeat-associated protein
MGLTFGRTDNLNLTSIGDTVTPANNQSFGYSAANRLNSASGPYGSQSWTYDGVGNRTGETIGGVTDTYTYPATSNRLQGVTRSGVTPDPRAFTYDGAGNIATDARSGVSYAYTYNNANRLKTVSQSGNLLGTYTYNGREQLATRVITNSGSANGTTHFVHDQWGNIIAELDATGATVREYIWLVGAEIAPTRGSRTQVDRPIAVVSNVNTAPALLTVHVDQLNRPVKMTDAAKAVVWSAVYSPFGAAYSITGSETLNARFPGQWFQLEAGLHYNWHRHYDPSLGRYTQPDPLGFVDGPSVYAYAKNSPNIFVDPDGRRSRSQSKPGGFPVPEILIPGSPSNRAFIRQCFKLIPICELIQPGEVVVDRPDGIPETLCDYACFDGEVRTVGHLGRISCPGIILQ